MPSEASAVGALQLPVPAGSAGDKFDDPIVEALLDFASFYIKDALDARIANLLPAGTIIDSVPVANRYTFSPFEPRGLQVKIPLPALFVYWDGMSSVLDWTIIQTYRRRPIEFMYVFEELPQIISMNERVGLFNAVDAAMHKMSRRQLHTSYTPAVTGEGRTASPCMGISQALAPLGIVDWKWLGGERGRFGIDEGPNAERREKKRSGRDWPAIRGKFEVMERVRQETLDPTALFPTGDATPDIPLDISASGGETSEVMDFMQRIMAAPDGSEQLGEPEDDG